jgi:hypothetical protein
MNYDALLKSLHMMAIALPTMFLVIGVFIGATKLLHKAFPASAEKGGDDEG